MYIYTEWWWPLDAISACVENPNAPGMRPWELIGYSFDTLVLYSYNEIPTLGYSTKYQPNEML